MVCSDETMIDLFSTNTPAEFDMKQKNDYVEKHLLH